MNYVIEFVYRANVWQWIGVIVVLGVCFDGIANIISAIVNRKNNG